MSKSNDAINKAIDMLLDEAAEIANEQECKKFQPPYEEIEFSKEHEERMKKLFRKEKRRIILKKIPKYSKIAACVILAGVVLVGTAVMCVAEWRNKVINIFLKDNTTHSEIKFVDSENAVVVGDYFFGYMPEGFEIIEEYVSDIDTTVTFHDGMTEITFHRVEADVKKVIDTEDAIVENIMVNNKNAIISIKKRCIILVWSDGKSAYTVSSSGENGPINKDKIIKIAQNIEKLEKN